MRVPVNKNRHWPINTIEGVWVYDWMMDRAPRPDLFDGGSDVLEHYWRVGDGDDIEYVHSSLWDELLVEARPPDSVPWQVR
jgi:hypothetical protein